MQCLVYTVLCRTFGGFPFKNVIVAFVRCGSLCTVYINNISTNTWANTTRFSLASRLDKYNPHSHIINSLEAERNHNFFCFLQLRAHAGVAGGLCHQFSAYSKNKKRILVTCWRTEKGNNEGKTIKKAVACCDKTWKSKSARKAGVTRTGF